MPPMTGITLTKVGPENLDECGVGCLTNRDSDGYRAKVAWLRERFPEGLRLLMFRDAGGKPLGFLEYVPGEYAWRPVDAAGWLFVHCLWVYRRGRQVGGLGALLIQACLLEAQRTNATGVAAMVSDGPWMAGREIFLRNGFVQVAESGRFQLVIHRLRDGPEPRFRDVPRDGERPGLEIVVADQCPMLRKSVTDVAGEAAAHGLDPKITVLGSAAEAQRAASDYGVYGLFWNGRCLSDHYVSRGRFRNLLRKEIPASERDDP